jgi:hypothetical protein
VDIAPYLDPVAIKRFADLVLHRSVAELKSRSVDAVLARTAYGPEYKAFHPRGRGPGETAALYGLDIYSRQIAGGLAQAQSRVLTNVRYWRKADIARGSTHLAVRFSDRPCSQSKGGK